MILQLRKMNVNVRMPCQIEPPFQSDFIGKEALKEKAGRYREMSCTMLEVEVNDADPEGNHTVYLCGKVQYLNRFIPIQALSVTVTIRLR